MRMRIDEKNLTLDLVDRAYLGAALDDRMAKVRKEYDKAFGRKTGTASRKAERLENEYHRLADIRAALHAL